ncbi:hypothetical protein JL720_13122 [Aureococcus anophagefferens]|nr:hypothetical protein JL720_13122 [Aureococcus anophagefferens]
MAEDVPLEEPPEPAPESSSGGFAQFMCCSTDSMDKDGSRAPVDMFCFKGRAEEDVDAPVDPPGDDDATADAEDPATRARPGPWAPRTRRRRRARARGGTGAAAAGRRRTAPPPAPGKRRASMAPKPASEKKRMSIFEAMQASVASAAGMGADDEEAVVLEAVLHKKGSGGGLIFGKSAAQEAQVRARQALPCVEIFNPTSMHCRDGEGCDVGPVLRYYDAAGAHFKGAILLRRGAPGEWLQKLEEEISRHSEILGAAPEAKTKRRASIPARDKGKGEALCAGPLHYKTVVKSMFGGSKAVWKKRKMELVPSSSDDVGPVLRCTKTKGSGDKKEALFQIVLEGCTVRDDDAKPTKKAAAFAINHATYTEPKVFYADGNDERRGRQRRRPSPTRRPPGGRVRARRGREEDRHHQEGARASSRSRASPTSTTTRTTARRRGLD